MPWAGTYNRADLAVLAAFKLLAWDTVGLCWQAWCGLRMKGAGVGASKGLGDVHRF